MELDYQEYVRRDERFYRPVEPAQLVANAEKALSRLGWEPRVDFDQLVQMMVDADLCILQTAQASQDILDTLSPR